MEQKEIWIKSTMDGTMQPSLYYQAAGEGKRPLMVGLHSWSHDRFNMVERMVPYAEKYNFNLLLPEFRGANMGENPHCREACGSRIARQDIKDAMDYVIKEYNADADNVFLIGASGGGMMTLLMCGLCPGYFKVAAAAVPITDLYKWYGQAENYRAKILACCGDSREEMADRSPMSYLDNIAKANLKIFHGKQDPLVPVAHSLDLYAKLMERHPTSRVYLDIFDGGHQMDMDAVMYWVLSQYENKELAQVTG